MNKKYIKKIVKNKEIKKRNLFLFFFIIVFFIALIIYSYIKTGSNNRESEKNQENLEINFQDHLFPMRNWEEESLDIEARSALVAYIDSNNNKKFVFEKNQNLRVPIASITKLMTTLIVLDNYDLNDMIAVSEDAFNKDFFRINNLYVKEEYQVKDILYPLLMESNNTAAYALAEGLKRNFVELMNEKAIELGMNDTFFVNPSGFDPPSPTATANYSTARDLIVLIENLLEKPLIWEILSLPEYDLIRQDGFFKYTIVNTNMMLGELPGIIGGKTGTTARAQQCFILVMKKNNQEYLIGVVLGSKDRFSEIKKMIDWVNEAYLWETTQIDIN